MYKLVSFVISFAAVFSVLVIFTEEGEKVKKVVRMLVASIIVTIGYYLIMHWWEARLFKKVVGRWESHSGYVIWFKPDKSLEDKNESKTVELFGRNYNGYTLNYTNVDDIQLTLYNAPEGFPDLYELKIVGDTMVIGRNFKFAKK